MSYSMFLAGELKLPAAQMSEYLAAPVEPERRRDAVGMLDLHHRMVVDVRTEAGEAVGVVLRELPEQLITAAGSWLKIRSEAKKGLLNISGVFVEDDFVDHGATLAEVFRIASEFGGRGALFLFEEQVAFSPQEPELCYAVRVTPGKSRVEHVSESEQEELVQSELFSEVLSRIRDELSVAPNLFLKAPAKPARKLPAKKRRTHK